MISAITQDKNEHASSIVFPSMQTAKGHTRNYGVMPHIGWWEWGSQFQSIKLISTHSEQLKLIKLAGENVLLMRKGIWWKGLWKDWVQRHCGGVWSILVLQNLGCSIDSTWEYSEPTDTGVQESKASLLLIPETILISQLREARLNPALSPGPPHPASLHLNLISIMLCNLTWA